MCSSKENDRLLDYQIDHDMDLHHEAGLAYSGMDAEGQAQWIGTDKQWDKYSKLVEAEGMAKQFKN